MTAAIWVVLTVVLLGVGGVTCLFLGRRGALSNRLGPAVSVLGGTPAVVGAVVVLVTGSESSLHLPWSIPFGSFSLAMDGLAAFFILAISVVCILSALYGGAYLKSYLGKSSQKNLGASWCFYNMLFASMLLVVTARNGVLFLLAWEGMSLASFFLVMFEHEKQEVRQAGWTYLIAMHLGTAFLLAMFVLLGWRNQTMDFDQFAIPSAGPAAGVIFLLAVVGFGTKAGFMPMHVWLPEAHPAAPSHVSAVMSGVMIKTGIYGLLRTLEFLGAPPAWWGWVLIGVGVVSGICGILFALAQHDLKRLLAYSSVENIGMISLGLGLWLLGTSTGNTTVATLGLLGGLLHVWNHAIFKSLLFLGAGAVAHTTGTLNIETMGGLLKRMKYTGLFFLIGSVAISGLPPLNGFVSEFLVYLGSFFGIARTGAMQVVIAGFVITVALALIGGLAAACFTKVCGIVFLGEPRSDAAKEAHEAPLAMRISMAVLAGLCVLIGLIGPLAIKAAAPATGTLLSNVTSTTDVGTTTAGRMLWHVSLVGVVLAVMIAILWWIRRRLLAGRIMNEAGTWDCGYAAPTARMQYTASSFASPILGMFRWLLQPRVHRHVPNGLFPAEANFESHTADVFRRFGFGPLFGAAAWLAGRLRWFQQGRNQLYVLYIALTLLILLLWNLG
ncbi:MAG: hypothetical protein JXA11_02390 [Phycisphaerae bacterium]|nr:hypothetical protein [Phycisphaerae bacterium]